MNSLAAFLIGDQERTNGFVINLQNLKTSIMATLTISELIQARKEMKAPIEGWLLDACNEIEDEDVIQFLFEI